MAVTVTVADIKKLRDKTSAGMMDCKRALEEAEGDFEKAVEILRKKGQAIAAKRSDREASEGCVLAKGPNIYPALVKRLEEIAIKHKVKYQVEVSPYPTGTDANVIQLSGEGVKTAVVSIPCRYMHTPHEVCSKIDIESAICIISEFLHYND